MANLENAPAVAKPVWPTSLDQYELFELIGSGASADVYRARCKPLNCDCAIKRLNLEDTQVNFDEIRKEIQVMGTCQHPNLLSYYATITAESYVYLVMPLLDGSVLDMIRVVQPQGIEDEGVIAAILYQIVEALAYLHSHGQIHRDVKAANVLVQRDGTCLLSDFGVSNVMREDGERVHGRQTFVGTPCWMAPEVVDTVVGYDERADIWSLGITAIELATGQAPLANNPPMKVLLMILQNDPPRLETHMQRPFSRAFQEFVDACLQKDFKYRPTAEKLLEFRFLRSQRPRRQQLIVDRLVTPFYNAGGLGEARSRVRENRRREETAPVETEWDFDNPQAQTIQTQSGISPPVAQSAPALPALHPAPITIPSTTPLAAALAPLPSQPVAPAPMVPPVAVEPVPQPTIPTVPVSIPTHSVSSPLPPPQAPASLSSAPMQVAPIAPEVMGRVYYRLQPSQGRAYTGILPLPQNYVLAQLRIDLRGDLSGNQQAQERARQWESAFGATTMACDVTISGPGIPDDSVATQLNGDLDDLEIVANSAQTRYVVELAVQ